MNLRIEEPCSENWNAMTPREQGRHCDKCCKTVIDFTKMPTGDILQFISSKEKGSVCGRFAPGQVNVASKPVPTVSWSIKKFLAALVLVFGGTLFTGCQEEPVGKLVPVDPPHKQVAQPGNADSIPETFTKDTMPVKKDSIKIHPQGKVSCEPGPPEDPDPNIQGGVTLEMPEIMGLMVIDHPQIDTTK